MSRTDRGLKAVPLCMKRLRASGVMGSIAVLGVNCFLAGAGAVYFSGTA